MSRGREALLPFVAPACLVGLALAQIVLVQTVQLSPWKGGGFGMFSTNDHGGFRVLRIVALGEGTERTLRVPEALARRARRARETPTRSRLFDLGRAFARVAGDATAGARALRVEVLRIEFDGELVPSLATVASATVDLAPGAVPAP